MYETKRLHFVWFFFQSHLFQKLFMASKRLNQDQAQRFVLPDLGPFYLQRLLADAISVEGRDLELTKYEPGILFVGHRKTV